jgi:hypothetical protein
VLNPRNGRSACGVVCCHYISVILVAFKSRHLMLRFCDISPPLLDVSTNLDQLPEDTPEPISSGGPTGKRGYFFYIAAFFILIALLCYLLNSTNVTWTQVVPEPSSAPPAPAPH